MSDLVTIDEAKAHLRIRDASCFDPLLAILVAAASEAVRDCVELWDGTGEVPARLKLAVLGRIAVAFEEASNVSAAEGEDRLLRPFQMIIC